jgi:ADP-ribose pyrophosphatase YjhB (NUDIX family)
MSDRYTFFVDLHLILRSGDRILLGKRINTGFGDGAYGLPAGHLEEGESAKLGMAREAAEEVCVTIDPLDLVLRHTMHHHTNSGRVALFFEATKWSGEIENGEPDKCEGWAWYDLNALPEPVVPYMAAALAQIRSRVGYSERGWGSSARE